MYWTFVALGLACSAGYSAFLLLLAWSFRAAVREGGSRRAAGGAEFPVSVVIPARNEEKHIGACLDAVLASADARCEVVVVDDASSDGTADAVRRRMGAGPCPVRLVTLEGADRAHKKRAVEAGVAAATGLWILQTDADCRPGPAWIVAMRRHMTDDAGFIAGPVLFAPDDGAFRGFQALEFCGMMGISAAAIRMGRPMLASGANLAFRRDLFDRVGGHGATDHVTSGDDVLLMHAIDRLGTARIASCTDPDAVVETPAQPDLEGFFNQRSRWASKAGRVGDPGLVALYSVIWGAFVFALVAFPAALAMSAPAWPAVAAWLLKVGGEFVMLDAVTRHYDRRRLLRHLVPWQPLHIAYVTLAPVIGLAVGFTWKGRRLAR